MLSQFLTYLTSAWDIYEKAGWENKFTLIKKIFPEGITFSDDAFRTVGLHETFHHFSKQLAHKGLLFSITAK